MLKSEAVQNIKVKVDDKKKIASYEIKIAADILNHGADFIKDIATPKSKALIVTDTNVAPLYIDALGAELTKLNIEDYLVVVEAGEQSKSSNCLKKVISAALNSKLNRSDMIIALGGGVVGDLAGFAAAIFLRGIKFLQIPTSLLAQVDSSVGGKVGINMPQGKNLLGTFYQPNLVLIDPLCLNTLPVKEFNGGMAEVIKYGLIGDESFLAFLKEKNLNKTSLEFNSKAIKHCCQIKRDFVEADPLDTGQRMKLNFGHTIGHALEQASFFEKFHHGEGIAIGMMMSALWGEELGYTKKGTAEIIEEVLLKYNLPTKLPQDGELVHRAIHCLETDKKNINNKLHFIFLTEIGKSVVKSVALQDLQVWLNKQSHLAKNS